MHPDGLLFSFRRVFHAKESDATRRPRFDGEPSYATQGSLLIAI